MLKFIIFNKALNYLIKYGLLRVTMPSTQIKSRKFALVQDYRTETLMAIIKEKEKCGKYKAVWIRISYGCRAKYF